MAGQSHKDSSRLENKLTKYFDDFLNDVGLTRVPGGIKLRSTGGADGKQTTWSPAIDIRETEREYIIIADVPVSFFFVKKIYHYIYIYISKLNKMLFYNVF